MRVGDLLNPDAFKRKLQDNLVEVNSLLRYVHKTNGFHTDKIYDQYMGYADRLRDYITDVPQLLQKVINQGQPILFEGAQGTHLDIDFGTYPYVTSSSSCAGGACIGAGVGPTKIDAVLGVTKAYTTRVGGGPFPTELTDEVGEGLKARGNEFGATTGRARRCGWFDAVLLRHAVRVNGLSSLAVTKLDVLDGCQELKICIGYRHAGKLYKEMPADLDVLSTCTPVYERFPGWDSDTTGMVSYKTLPTPAKRYLARIEELTECPIDMISTGSKREHTIILKNPLVSKKKSTRSHH